MFFPKICLLTGLLFFVSAADGQASLPLRHLQITSSYGYRIHPITGKYAFHSGIDLRARHDTVFAVLPGSVSFSGYTPLLGFYIRLDHGEFQIIYGHLSQIFVLAGDPVLAGTPVGLSGASGRVTGEHLHFGVQFRHVNIDPVKFLYSIQNNLNQ